MNQKVLLILLILLPFDKFSFAQKIEPGKYVSVYDYSPTTGKYISFGEYSHKIIIPDNKTFKYFQDYCGEIEMGFGEYSISKNKIDFYFFEIPDTVQILPFYIKKEYETNNDSTIYDFHVLYENKQVEYSRILYISEKYKNVFKIYQTDTGVTRIFIKKSDIPAKFEISYIGYGQANLTFKDSLNKEIIVNLDAPNKFSIPETKLVYKIKSIGKNGFYLKGGFWKDWTFFKKED